MKKKEFSNNENAVSPVIGVMLMIVVTVILAAAVSGYAGGIGGNMQKAPQLTMDVAIKNTGYATSSYILFDVLGVSEPIPTKDLKIITSWNNNTAVNGATIVAWDGTAAGKNSNTGTYSYHSPLGFGVGVTPINNERTSGNYDNGQYFGNYILIAGTSMKNSPHYTTTGSPSYTYNGGYGLPNQYEYEDLSFGTDGMQAILGSNWYELRPGDIVNVKIVHIPSGKVIYEKNVGVE